MLLIYPSSAQFENKVDKKKPRLEKAPYSTLDDHSFLEFDMQRLRWEYKNMREKKSFIGH